MLKKEFQRRQQTEKIAFFEPNGPQERFIEKVGDGRNMVGIFSAANGVGKTALVVNVLGNIVWGAQNKFFDLPIFQNWPFPKRARYVTTPKNVEDIGPFHSEIDKWWPKGRYRAEKSGKSFYSQYHANEWVIDVMTYDQEPSQFEGPNLGAVIFDEPPPKDIWNACISRLRLGGLLLVFMTPLTEAAWFFEEVVPRHQDRIVYASMEDNCKTHGIRGQLEHERIEAVINEIDTEEVEARVYGKAMYLRGLIYKTFNPAVHVLKQPIQPPHNAAVWNVVDPHSDKPFASIWGFPDVNGTIYITDEWPNEDFYKMHGCQLTIDDYRKIFRDKEVGLYIQRRVIDRHFADVRSAVNKRTLREELRDIGLLYEPSYIASEEIETGIIKVRSHLQYDSNKPISALNQPKIFINPNCRNTIKGFQYWSRDPKNGKVRDEFKDFMDCVRMMVMDNPKVEAPIPEPEIKSMWG